VARHATPAILAIALSACGLAASAGLTGSTTSSSTSSSTSSPGGPPSSGAASAPPWDHPGMLVRDQLLPLVGLTVDAARQRLKQLGYDGHLEISENYHYIDKCGQNKVCAVEPEAGTGLHDELRLVINKKLDIAAPPP